MPFTFILYTITFNEKRNSEDLPKLLDKITNFYTHSRRNLLNLFRKTILYNRILSDKKALEISYKIIFKTSLNLQNPSRFNEKLQWLKLYNRKPQHTINVDKYRVREFVKEKIGEQYLIPLIGVYDDPREINFEELPNQFVLKCNHNSGRGMCICTDKSKLNIKKTRRNLKKGLKENYYLHAKEWPYKNVERKIICEKFMTDNSNKDLIDYKFMCFNGQVKMIFTTNDRHLGNKMKIDFFDTKWNILPFTRHYPGSEKPLGPPKNLKKMIELANILSKDELFVRVDFYEINDKIYFGELTYFPGSGFEEFTPDSWDEKIGKMIDLKN